MAGSIANPALHLPFCWRVAFADTDSGGVVYHSRYLEWAERARSSWLHQADCSNTRLLAEGIVFAVRECHVFFAHPARLDDELVIKTMMQGWRGARLHLLQHILLNGRECVRIDITLACLNRAGRPARIPRTLQEKLSGWA